MEPSDAADLGPSTSDYAAAVAGTEDREWTHDPLERSFFATVGRGYLIGVLVFGLFAFLVARTQAPEWGTAAAIGAAAFVAVFVGVLGGVVLIGLWAMKNEELIRGNETGHTEDHQGGHTDHVEAEPVESRRPSRPEPGRDAEPADAETAEPADAEAERRETRRDVTRRQRGGPGARRDGAGRELRLRGAAQAHGYRRGPCVPSRASACARRCRPSCRRSSAWP